MTRLCNPPREFRTLSIIQVVAEPQITSRISLRSDAHVFQNHSKAFKNPEHAESNQGSSSRNTTFLASGLVSSNPPNSPNASIQEFSFGQFFAPYRRRAILKASSCSFFFPRSMPAAWKAYFPANNSFIRNVLPTRPSGSAGSRRSRSLPEAPRPVSTARIRALSSAATETITRVTAARSASTIRKKITISTSTDG